MPTQLTEIYNATKYSRQISDAFNACVPVDISLEDKDGLKLLLLRKYNAMRARDFLKTLNRIAVEADVANDTFSLRGAILINQYIAKGTTPAATS